MKKRRRKNKEKRNVGKGRSCNAGNVAGGRKHCKHVLNLKDQHSNNHDLATMTTTGTTMTTTKIW